jgi:O-antigen/teichoic acid export membrane protein
MLSVFAIVFIVKTNLYMGRIVPTAMVTIGFGMIVIVLVYRNSHIIYNKEYLKFALGISAPLVLHGIALNILSQSDRTMITWLADASQTGIYSLVYNFSMLATVITTAIEGVWVPWFTSKLKSHEIKEINVLVRDYINLMTYAMVALIFVGPEIIKLLAVQKYWEGMVIIPPIILANYFIFAYTLYVNIEHFYKKTLFITVNTLIAAGINIFLNLILIPRYGYVAAAYTTLVAYFVAFILHSSYAKKLEKDLYPLHFFIRPMVHILISTVIFYLCMDGGVLRWILMVIYEVTMAIRERKRLKMFFPGIITRLKRK